METRTAPPAADNTNDDVCQGSALVFGAYSEQGRAVMEGLLLEHASNYGPVYGFDSAPTSSSGWDDRKYLMDALGCTDIVHGELQNIDEVRKVLELVNPSYIFVVTSTDLPSIDLQDYHMTTGYWNIMEEEYETIIDFFTVLIQFHYNHTERRNRHVIFSTYDNVQAICNQYINTTSGGIFIEPLDDGSIVPHYSAKGRGSAKVQNLIDAASIRCPHDAPALYYTRLTIPFLYSNFLGFFTPLPTTPTSTALAMEDDNNNNIEDTNATTTQWQLSACFGDGNNPIDMMSVSDLSTLIPHIFEQPDVFHGKNLRVASERISMDQIASEFANLFGKDVIYNPLHPNELASLPFSSAPVMAQMCQFWAKTPCTTTTTPANSSSQQEEEQATPTDNDNNGNVEKGKEFLSQYYHDIELTKTLLFPKKPQTFKDWLLIHSDSTAFSKVGLDRDAPEITSVTVFNATTPQGISVIRGLLQDTRKKYFIRGTTRDLESDACQKVTEIVTKIMKEMDGGHDNNNNNNRFEFVRADLDDIDSCIQAVENMDGAFLVTDFFQDADRHLQQIDEKHAKNVIDACEVSHSIKHLVFSTMENIEAMNRVFELGLDLVVPSSSSDDKTNEKSETEEGFVIEFDAKAKAAAYARTKKISVTYVLMPCYSELFFDMIERKPCSESPGGEKLVLTIPSLNGDTKLMCMSIDDLGPAVANIFDSYQVYAGHEIGLVTDFVSVSDIKDIIQDVFLTGDGNNGNTQQELESKSDANDNDKIKFEAKHMTKEEWAKKHSVVAKDTYMKDLGQMFAYLAHTDAVKKRHSIAKTMKLVPSAKPLRKWVELNKDNQSFREKLGLR